MQNKPFTVQFRTIDGERNNEIFVNTFSTEDEARENYSKVNQNTHTLSARLSWKNGQYGRVIGAEFGTRFYPIPTPEEQQAQA
jgi:hypothetical protein